ncbi:adenosylcobinamide-phosphate synthase CbiB [Leptolyngbya sp. FACHB-261]|uniref:adenosylcobinamide-phosphate synthase CbiB n=1 Tax=Leptolyngbya sp. FACHB-261 TaxID=2692806 RepID=UPI001682AAB4|nr:adenosylcobinamide-phosphate synthase CbiB [Leptolyngbya sp. FACHB-261]MBD2105067.1 cobalamin biosynthesis protein CobD [Leptolyngbya sp. FACHB-261]
MPGKVPETALILILATGLDWLLGDPWSWPHPVSVMGWVIAQYRDLVWKRLSSPVLQKLAGVVLMLILVLGSGSLTWLLIAVAQQIHPWFGLGTASILLASCFAERSLRDAAHEVLAAPSLEQARLRLSRYVGRDTENLSQLEILRATLETVSENAIDGVLAPLFYAIVGSFTPLGAPPVAMAYKALSTLDSMVGYREAPYTDLGWCSARTEDAATWLPCRLGVLSIALLSGRPAQVLRLCQRDASADPSPNAGWSECAYAAALEVQLGGANTYRGVLKVKPLLGDSKQTITAGAVEQALRLTRWMCWIWVGIAVLLLSLNSQALAN